MNLQVRSTSLSRQFTPKKRNLNTSLSSFVSGVKQQKKYSHKLETRVKNLEKYAKSNILRSESPGSLANKEPRLNLDLKDVCKGSVSIIALKNSQKSITERKASTPLRISPTPHRIGPQLDNSDLSYNQRNIEKLRNELQQKREVFVELKESNNREQLENKYWSLVSETELVASKIMELKKFNNQIRREISMLQKNY
jgi:hypothetical protein